MSRLRWTSRSNRQDGEMKALGNRATGQCEFPTDTGHRENSLAFSDQADPSRFTCLVRWGKIGVL